MRAAYFDCLSGASGNMLLGAFLDAGASPAAVQSAVAALGLAEDVTLAIERVSRGGIESTHVQVNVLRPRPWGGVADIDRLIATATLDEGVKERSRLAFRLLATAEAEAHGVDVSRVVLHETGAVDAVVDVVGTFAAAADLNVESFYGSTLPYCEGTTSAAHGVIPLPAPATMRILDAVGASTYRRDGEAELVTPTGAAIIGACASFTAPRMEVELEGFGAGTAELAWPNVLRVAIGDVAVEASPESPAISLGAEDASALGGLQRVTVIETNIDDMPPDLLADVPAAMLKQGAVEAFLTPVVMKKGRPGHLLTVICAPDLADTLAASVLRQTSTLGVRMHEERRMVARRELVRFQSSLGEVGVKLKYLDGRVVDAVPEHDDLGSIADKSAVTAVEAQRLIGAEARAHFIDGPI